MKLNFKNINDNDLYKLLNDKSKEVAEKSFAELYGRYSRRLYLYCRKLVGDANIAKDAFQDTFVTFFNSSKEYKEIPNISAYLYRVAHNFCLNSLKKERVHSTIEDYMVPSMDFNPESDELLGLIKTALELLPLEFRVVFVLKEYEGMTYVEIADILAIPQTTVKIRSHRARQKIRKVLAPYLADLSK